MLQMLATHLVRLLILIEVCKSVAPHASSRTVLPPFQLVSDTDIIEAPLVL